MSYEHTLSDQHHDAAPEQHEQTILDIVEERFWNPYADLLELREQHRGIGLDTSALDKEIEEFYELYLSLGGAELTSAENDVNVADNVEQATIAEARFHRAQEKFYANLLKHDGVDTASTTETASDSTPVTLNAPQETGAKTPEAVSSIKVGDTVRNRPKRKESEPAQEWSNEWKVVKILPPTDKVPKEVVMLELNGVKDFVGMDTLLERQTPHKPKRAEKSTDTPIPAEPVADKSEPVVVPKKPTRPTHVRGGTHQRKDGTFAVAKMPEHYEEFIGALEDKLHEMVKYGRMTQEQADARLEDGRNIPGGLTGHAVKDAFRFANADPTIKEHNRRTARENQLAKADRPVFGDERTDKWFSDIMENTSISQAQKEYLLSFGPDGPQRDKIDTNEIKRQLEAEGFDYSNILSDQPLSSAQQAELSDTRVAFGLASSSESLSDDQLDQLLAVSESLGLPAAKKVKVGRALLKSASRLPRKSYEATRELTSKGGGWINRGERDNAPEKTDEDKKLDERSEKVGKKVWSIFSLDEKPKSNDKIKKNGLKASKKLGKTLKRRQQHRG